MATWIKCRAPEPPSECEILIVSPESVELLKNLIDAPSPSGYEQAVQSVFRSAVAPYADVVQTDVLGNVCAIVNSSGDPGLMLAGHCDEIGFIVTRISSEGYLSFGMIGSHDPNIVVGQRVLVHTLEGSLPGVVGRQPIHLMDDDAKTRPINIYDLFVDIGAMGYDSVASIVAVGDSITYEPGFTALRGNLAASHGFDNKVGVLTVAQVLRSVNRSRLSASVYGVSTVQEEVGRRGAQTSSYATGAKVGVAIDVAHTSDYPSVSKSRVGDLALGKGPILTRGANTNPELFKVLRALADEHRIPYQLKGDGRATDSDANTMQVNQAGMAVTTVSIPLRYMHTPGEVICLDDIDNTIHLLTQLAEFITPTTDFTPRLDNLHTRPRID